MIRNTLLVLALALPLSAFAGQKVSAPLAPLPNGKTPPKAETTLPNGNTPTQPASAGSSPAAATIPVVANVNPPAAVPVLPPMRFISTVAEDEVLTALKAEPALAALDKDLVGSPLGLAVTHTIRPTAAGTAAGLLSAVLSGGTLGILPMVTNDRLVVRYEVLLNGKVVTSYTFERTATRAQNLWTVGTDGTNGLGKSGVEWVQSTAKEVAGKLTQDPAMIAVRDEIEFYFPSRTIKSASTAKP